MKCVSVTLLLMCICTFSVLQAQDTTGFQGFHTPSTMPKRINVIKSSPVPLLLMGQIPICNELRITYERVLANHHSVIIGGSYNFPNLWLLMFSEINDTATKMSDYSFRGGRVMLGYRYYPLKKIETPGGLFFGPYASYNFVRIKEKGGNGSYLDLNYFNVSAIVGYQIVTGSGFSIEWFMGFGYRNNFGTGYDARTNRFSNEDIFRYRWAPHFKYVLQMNMGYAF